MLVCGTGRHFYKQMLEAKHILKKEAEAKLQDFEQNGYVRAYLDGDRSDPELKQNFLLVQKTYDELQHNHREISYFEKIIAKPAPPTEHDLAVPTHDDRGHKVMFPLRRQTFLLICLERGKRNVAMCAGIGAALSQLPDAMPRLGALAGCERRPDPHPLHTPSTRSLSSRRSAQVRDARRAPPRRVAARAAAASRGAALRRAA